MDMARAPRVLGRHDGLEPIAPLAVGVLVAAIAKALVVVVAVLVGVPEIEQRVGYRFALRGHDDAGNDQTRLAVLDQRNALRRARFEERPGGLRRRLLAAGLRK